MKSIHIRSQLIIAFIILVIFIISISVWAFMTLNKSNALFQDLYQNPVTVKEAAFEAYSLLLEIKSNIKEVATSDSQTEQVSRMLEINSYYDTFFNKFYTVLRLNNRYAPLIKEITTDYSIFNENRSVLFSYILRDEKMNALAYCNKVIDTDIAILSKKTKTLIEETQKETTSFYNTSQKQLELNLYILIYLTFGAIFLSIFISVMISYRMLSYEKALYLEKEYFKVMLRSIGDGVIAIDTNKKVRLLNSVAEKFTGWTQEMAIGKDCDEVFNLSHENGYDEIVNPVDIVLKNDEIYEMDDNVILKSKDGTIRNIADSAAPIKNENGVTTGVVIVFRDETEKRFYDQKIKYISYHDGLTGLFNRAFFESEIERLNNKSNLPVTVIIGDVNGLKLINDVFGHVSGDQLLVRIASILTECSGDNAIVSRWGGDEFAILIPSVLQNEAEEICKNIKKRCTQYSTETLILSISLGIATRQNSKDDLYMLLKDADDRMYSNKLSEGRAIQQLIIDMAQKVLSKRSFETEAHIKAMLKLVDKMDRTLGLSKHEMNELRLLIQFHDIGKIGVPESILNKPKKLNEFEWNEIRRHPEIGYRIVRALSQYSHIAEYVYTHHERWDGKGYPQGLKGEEIPRLARLISIIDAYDAMINERPYRSPLSSQEALVEIAKCSGTQFDPELVQVFLKAFNASFADFSPKEAG